MAILEALIIQMKQQGEKVGGEAGNEILRLAELMETEIAGMHRSVREDGKRLKILEPDNSTTFFADDLRNFLSRNYLHMSQYQMVLKELMRAEEEARLTTSGYAADRLQHLTRYYARQIAAVQSHAQAVREQAQATLRAVSLIARAAQRITSSAGKEARLHLLMEIIEEEAATIGQGE